MAVDAMRVLEAMAHVSWGVLGQCFRPDCCIAATRIGIEALRAFAIPARELPVKATVMNEAYYQYVIGKAPLDEKRARYLIIDETCEGPGYSGHLVIVGKTPKGPFILDLATYQFNRPQKEIHFPPEGLVVPLLRNFEFKRGWSASAANPHGGAVTYAYYPNAPDYRKVVDWAMPYPEQREIFARMVSELVAATRAELARQPSSAGEASGLPGNENLDYLLGPIGSVRAIGPEMQNGGPARRGDITIVRYDSEFGSVRYIALARGVAVGALQLVTRDGKHAQIANVYVQPAWRRRGIAAALLERARKQFQTITHSTDLSPAGAAWRTAVGEESGYDAPMSASPNAPIQALVTVVAEAGETLPAVAEACCGSCAKNLPCESGCTSHAPAAAAPTGRLTNAQVKAQLAPHGIVFSKKDGEFRVNFRGGDEATAYYTPDIDDALATGLSMARSRAGAEPAEAAPIPAGLHDGAGETSETGEAAPDEEHQGWTNFETWKTNIYVTQERHLYEAIIAHPAPFTAETAQNFVKRAFPRGTADLRPSEYKKVNWAEIAASWNEIRRDARNSNRSLNEGANEAAAAASEAAEYGVSWRQRADGVWTADGSGGTYYMIPTPAGMYRTVWMDKGGNQQDLGTHSFAGGAQAVARYTPFVGRMRQLAPERAAEAGEAPPMGWRGPDFMQWRMAERVAWVALREARVHATRLEQATSLPGEHRFDAYVDGSSTPVAIVNVHEERSTVHLAGQPTKHFGFGLASAAPRFGVATRAFEAGEAMEANDNKNLDFYIVDTQTGLAVAGPYWGHVAADEAWSRYPNRQRYQVIGGGFLNDSAFGAFGVRRAVPRGGGWPVYFASEGGGETRDFLTQAAAVAHAYSQPDGDRLYVYYGHGKFHLAKPGDEPHHATPVSTFRRPGAGEAGEATKLHWEPSGGGTGWRATGRADTYLLRRAGGDRWNIHASGRQYGPYGSLDEARARAEWMDRMAVNEAGEAGAGAEAGEIDLVEDPPERVWPWLTRNGMGRQAYSVPIGWYQVHQDHAERIVKTAAEEAFSAHDPSWSGHVRVRNGQIQALGKDRPGKPGQWVTLHITPAQVFREADARSRGAKEAGEVAAAEHAPHVPEGQVCRPWVRMEKDPQAFNACMALAQKVGPLEGHDRLYEIVRQQMQREDQEVFYAIVLDTHLHLRAMSEISRGGRDRVPTPIPDLVRVATYQAVHYGGMGLGVAHCHPSGKPRPSEADKQVTQAVEDACRALGIMFVDHLVIGAVGHGYYSFRKKKIFRPKA